MYCPKCGAELVDEAKFCSKCGNQVSGEVIDPEKIKEKIENSPIETVHQKESEQPQKDSQLCGSVSSKKTNLPKFIILGVVILSILCLLLGGKFLKSEGIESYYGVYNNGSSWYLIFTDGKTFSGDENKAEDAYLYLYNIISGQTLGKYFEDWNKNSSLISIGGILDVVGTDGYYVDFELLFEENNRLTMKYPNDERADYFTLVTKDVVSFMQENPQDFGAYSLYENYINGRFPDINKQDITTTISGFYDPCGLYAPEFNGGNIVEFSYGSGDNVWVLNYGGDKRLFSTNSPVGDNDSYKYYFTSGNDQLIVTATEPDKIYIQCVSESFGGFNRAVIEGYYNRTVEYILP